MPFHDPVAIGALGGAARAAKLTPAQRSESARRAAKGRIRMADRVAKLEERIAQLEQQLSTAA